VKWELDIFVHVLSSTVLIEHVRARLIVDNSHVERQSFTEEGLHLLQVDFELHGTDTVGTVKQEIWLVSSLGARPNEGGEVVERLDPVIVEVRSFHLKMSLGVGCSELIAVLCYPVELRSGHEAEVQRSSSDRGDSTAHSIAEAGT
jgi:hypothetical protein